MQHIFCSSMLSLGIFLLLALTNVSEANELIGLRSEHPRVVATETDFARVRELVITDQIVKRWYSELKEEGNQLLQRPLAKYEIPDGKRLLGVSRRALRLVTTLGLLHQVDQDKKYVDRIWLEVQSVCAFKDWNPSHFLDVGEMALAVALAYDWLYDEWSDGQREIMCDALVRLALQPSIDAYDRGTWWTKVDSNWAQVCNGGLIAAALAIGDKEPDVSTKVIRNGIPSVERSMARYAPDGGYEEGPAYWRYGTMYNVILIAALDSAIGHDFGLSNVEGFNVTGRFVPAMTGPTGAIFNFGDGDLKAVSTPAFLYLARRFKDPYVAHHAIKVNPASPFNLLWYDPTLLESEPVIPPLMTFFSQVGVASMRTSWDDPAASFVGIKGGENGVSHGQLDLGSFIYESDGVRWFLDLGRDDYNLPGYFDAGKNGKRWKYYRNRAEGHNTIVINGSFANDQPIDAVADVEIRDSEARVDLREVMGGDCERTFAMNLDSGELSITDQINLNNAANVWWFAHTKASVQLSSDQRLAVLSEDNKEITVTIKEPTWAKFTVMDAKPLSTSPNLEGQNPNDGSRLLNASNQSGMVKTGVIPLWGDPSSSRAIRKLSIQMPVEKELAIQVVISKSK